MKELRVKDILKICNGKLICGNEEEVCNNFSKDTRQITLGDVYVGIKGENFDGSNLYEDALKNGAKICLLDEIELKKEVYEKYSNATIVTVKNTIEAIQNLAKYKRSLYDIPVVAVTGSVGKTSTKDMIASVVATSYKVQKTSGNYNNHIGLPFTILGLKDHTALVVEMGMNHFGELSLLTNIAKPTICVITNVGTAHIGNLGSRENILKAKLEILEGLSKDGIVIINNDNDLLHKWNDENKQYKVMDFGIENESHVMANDINLEEYGSRFKANIYKNKEEVDVPVSGIHFVYNSLCAICVGESLNISKENILKGIKEFELSKNRMEIIENSKGTKIINDCYNANFDSMKASIEALSRMNVARKIAVLGNMLELGEYSTKLHENVGREVAKNKIDILITVGEEAKNIAKQAIADGMNKDNVYVLDTVEDAIKIIQKQEKTGDAILVKASNGMNFKKIVENIKH
jgi:UDP-N-acetylmuramoyl-tripeptide--D-alanyl-D-alanine ligase